MNYNIYLLLILALTLILNFHQNYPTIFFFSKPLIADHIPYSAAELGHEKKNHPKTTIKQNKLPCLRGKKKSVLGIWGTMRNP